MKYSACAAWFWLPIEVRHMYAKFANLRHHDLDIFIMHSVSLHSLFSPTESASDPRATRVHWAGRASSSTPCCCVNNNKRFSLLPLGNTRGRKPVYLVSNAQTYGIRWEDITCMRSIESRMGSDGRDKSRHFKFAYFVGRRLGIFVCNKGTVMKEHLSFGPQSRETKSP